MAERIVQEESLTLVADAIRAKGGTSDALSFPTGFADAISAIQAGGGGGGIDSQLLSLNGNSISAVDGEFVLAENMQDDVFTITVPGFIRLVIVTCDLSASENLPEGTFLGVILYTTRPECDGTNWSSLTGNLIYYENCIYKRADRNLITDTASQSFHNGLINYAMDKGTVFTNYPPVKFHHSNGVTEVVLQTPVYGTAGSNAYRCFYSAGATYKYLMLYENAD